MPILFKNAITSEQEAEMFEKAKGRKGGRIYTKNCCCAQTAAEQEKSAAVAAGISDSVQKGILFGKECLGSKINISGKQDRR